MPTLSTQDGLAQDVIDAIRGGDVETLADMLAAEPWLARVWIDDNDPRGSTSRAASGR